MAGNKTVIILLALLAVPSVAGLTFDASIGPDLTISTKQIEVQNNVSPVQTSNLTVTNTGSIGCEFQLRSVFNNSQETYSRSVALWPGESAFLETNQLFRENGSYRGALYLEYCGDQSELKEFNFTAEGLEGNFSEVNSTTIAAGNSGLNVSLPVKQGLLVPEEKPHYWKVSSAEIVNGSADIDLQAPIFDRDESVRFAIYNQSSEQVEGFTTVQMKSEVEKTYWEKTLQNLERKSIELLLVSVFVNLVLIVLLGKASSPDLESLKESMFRD